MSQLKLTADSGGGTVAIKAPASTTGNAALDLVVPGTAAATLDTLGRAGNILQVVQTVKTDTFTTTSTSFTDITGFSVNITPSSSSSKILITGVLTHGTVDTAPYGYYFKLLRDSTDINIADAAGNRTRATFGTQGNHNGPATTSNPFEFLDSPSTTSQITYKVQARVENPKTLYVNRGNEDDGDNAIVARFTSCITVKEVAA